MRFLAAALVLLPTSLAAQSVPPRFELTLTPAAAARMRELGLETPVYGRAYVIVTRDSTAEARRQVGVAGVPFWGRDVEAWQPGTALAIEDRPDVFGHPLRTLAELPPGEYFAQAFLNVYTTFRRADGHTVRLHQDAGDGQDPWISPGNAHSGMQRITVGAGGTIRLALGDVIAPIDPVPPGGTLQQGNPADRPHVRFVKLRSERLSKFWGRDMYLGANVLLPRSYDSDPAARFPAVYLQGHYPGSGAPFGFGRPARGGAANPFDEFWLSADAPQLVAISIRDANPFYDTSYSVNSANTGPYGDAIVHELIPYLERTFRLQPGAASRLLAGGSTGGWEALALQVFYPDVFGGAWGWCPDAVDFRYHQVVDIYRDRNAYTLDRGWLQVDRPGMRRPDGNVLYSMRDENWFEHAVGNRGRSGGQWAIWEAVYGPVGADGYPARIWDPITGTIDSMVAAYWKQHYDLGAVLRRDWRTLGPKLAGKLHVTVGTADNFYLEQAVYLLEEFLAGTTDPPARATFEYGARKAHCWIGYSQERPGQDLSQQEFVRILGRYLER